MATNTHIRTSTATALLLAATVVGTPMRAPSHPSPVPHAAVPAADGADGRDTQLPLSHRPGVEIAFPRESYAAGQTARLRVYTAAADVALDIVHAGLESSPIGPNDFMDGEPVTQPRRLAAVRPGEVVSVPIGDWPSGFYFARLRGPGGREGYAPFVLRPKRLGEHRIAVVMPTQTWQAYNFHDDNGDGLPDTWYAGRGQTTARLGRPFYNRGVPPHYKYYDQPFLRWLVQTRKEVDFLADSDLISATSGRSLARAYDLLVFEGHHEYVTSHEYDVVTAFRNLGGNLMFLSANNFYWKITRNGNVMTRIAKWRDLGRPEAALIGVQYFHNDMGEHRGPWRVKTTTATPWLFAGTDHGPGSTMGSGGIEADATASASPRSVRIVAAIPNLFGTGQDAQMTYYVTTSGARVFAAGAFTLAGEAIWPSMNPFMENLWRHLATP
jgi:hypothetical protein